MLFRSTLVINLVLNLLLIPPFRMYGSAIANFISFYILSLLFYYFSKKEYFFEYEWNKLYLILCVSILSVFPFFYFTIQPLYLQILLKLFALVIFPLILYPFGFYEKIEIESIKGFLNKYLFRKSYNNN